VYHIVFIDESREDVEIFLDYIEGCNLDDLLTVTTLIPLPSVEDLVEQIFELGVDAIIVDFKLNEYRELFDYNVPYSGVDLVEAVLNHREGFPCFVMTSFDDDAIKASHDVNVVYQKDILHGGKKEGEQQARFVDRVMQQIEHYKAHINGAEKEFNRLISQSREEQLNAKEETLLKELDRFLERSAHKHAAIPDSLKDATMKADLHKLIMNTDKLLEDLDEKRK